MDSMGWKHQRKETKYREKLRAAQMRESWAGDVRQSEAVELGEAKQSRGKSKSFLLSLGLDTFLVPYNGCQICRQLCPCAMSAGRCPNDEGMRGTQGREEKQ